MAKIIKNNIGNSLIVLFVFLIVLGWMFSGWPRIWQKPPLPPEVQEARAAQTTIDSTVSTTPGSHNGTTQTTVFVSDQVGYRFYRDSNGSCVYRKTTDGGASWGSTITVDAQTDCLRVAVWYDNWTPGDSGNFIHIATMDSGSDDLWYNRLDTFSDTLLLGQNPVNITGANQGGSFSANQNFQSITKGTDGTIYIGVADNNDSFVVECSSVCNQAGNWTETGVNPMDNVNGDGIYLAPLPAGDILLVNDHIATDDFRSKVWHNNSGSWDTGWTMIDANASDNTTYDAAFSLSADQMNNDIYLAYAADISTLGTNDDIRTAVYSGGVWTLKSDVLTNDSKGITGVAISRDSNSDDVYVIYSARTVSNSASTANVYWKKSIDGMNSWGEEHGPINSSSDDIYGVTLNTVNDQRIYASWYGAAPDSIFGDTVADIIPPTYSQSAYRWFNNTDSTDVGSPLANQDEIANAPSQGTPFRLRLLLHISGDGVRKNLNSLKLQFAESSGGCDSAFLGESYTDLSPGSGVIRYYTGNLPNDGEALTPNANDPVHNGDQSVNQSYEEINNFTNSAAKILAGQDGKWDFSLVNFSAPAGAAFCFRVVKADNSLLSAYNVIPEILIQAPPANWLAEENFPANAGIGQNVRLRIQVVNAGTPASADYLLEYAQKIGNYCGDDESFLAVPPSLGMEHFVMSSSVYVKNSSPTTFKLTSPGYDFVPGKIVSRPSNSSGSFDLELENYTEFEFVIKAVNNASGLYCFRLTNAGTPLGEYPVYPELEITP